MAAHNELGQQGEKAALHYLIADGYEILETNFRLGKSEIDIIARQNEMLIFVEVKTRRSKVWGNPEDTISVKKMQLLMKAAYYYMEIIKHEWEIRFDVIGIVLPKNGHIVLTHFKDAFVP